MNEDGTLKRITNWDKLTPREQALVHKRLNERNKVCVPASASWHSYLSHTLTA